VIIELPEEERNDNFSAEADVSDTDVFSAGVFVANFRSSCKTR